MSFDPAAPDAVDIELAGILEEAARVAGACRVCGCTDDAACWPTCWWVETDLCSRCAAKGRPTRS